MKSREVVVFSAVMLLLAAGVPGWSQTGIAELQTTMGMMETLDEASTGPPASTVGRVGAQLGQPGAAPTPAGAAAPAAAPGAAAPEGAPDEAASDAIKPPETREGDEGTPFSFDAAAKHANRGMAHLRALQFNEAVEAYRQAKEADERYTAFYNKAVELRDEVNKGNLEEVKKKKVKDDLELTWGQFLDWERAPARVPGAMMPGMMGGYPGMYDGGLAGPMPPGAMGPAAPGAYYPPSRSGKY